MTKRTSAASLRDCAFNVWGAVNLIAMFWLIVIEVHPQPRWMLITWLCSMGAWMAIERFCYRRTS
jgi:predicted phosphatase